MTSTTYYNLNIVEGTDIVNPLVVDNPNYEKIDGAMHDNAVAGVTLATEIANATVHAITRENSDCAVIRFIATSEWKAGDTATVDGVPVTTLLPSGETLPDGAYVINANVLCILTGTNLTVYLGSKKVENANEIPFNNTTVGAELVRLDEEAVRLDGEIVKQNGKLVKLDEKIDNVNSNLNNVYNNVYNNTPMNISFPYTATGNCLLWVQTYASNKGNSYAKVYINGIERIGTQTESTGVSRTDTIPLYTNDVVRIEVYNGGSVNGKVYTK